MTDTRELFSIWQSSISTPGDEELSSQIRTLEAVLLDNQRLGYEIYSHLVRFPEQAEEARPVLGALSREQSALSLKLGELLLEWRRRGGNFDLRRRGEPRIAPRSSRLEEGLEGEEEESEVTSPRFQEPPVSAEALQAWKEKLYKKQITPPRPAEVPESRQRTVLLSLMNTIGEIRDLNTMVNIVDEVDGLEKITSTESRTQWAMMSKGMQRLWLAMLVARTRAVKDVTTTNPGLRERIKTFILHFPAYAKTYQPGYVNGLQVSHNPETTSWRDDALLFWSQLKQMTVAPLFIESEDGDGVPVFAQPPPSSNVIASVPASVEEDDNTVISSQWPFWPWIRDKRGILLGGEPREPARLRLESTFAMAELDWVPGDNPRRLESVIERVSQNKIDIVFVLQQWTAHKVTNKLIDACKSSGVPWALINSYSIRSLQSGIERFLAPSQEASL